MNLILKTKYTLSTEFVLAQVRGNNHWRTSQVRLEILNYRTLLTIIAHLLISLKISFLDWYNLKRILKVLICWLDEYEINFLQKTDPFSLCVFT